MNFSHSRDTANLIQMTAAGRDGMNASIAYDRVLVYFQAARTQQRRITRLIQKNDLYLSRLARRDDLSSSRPAHRNAFSQIFTEIHFYFIAWNTIHEMLEVLSLCSHLSCVKPLLSRHRRLLRDYGDGRDALEHYRDRLPGGKRGYTMSLPSDMGNLHGSNFTFGGHKWDVGPNSIKLLKSIVTELEQATRREASDKYQGLCSTR